MNGVAAGHRGCPAADAQRAAIADFGVDGAADGNATELSAMALVPAVGQRSLTLCRHRPVPRRA